MNNIGGESDIMYKNEIEIIDDAYKFGKHNRKLQDCRSYMNSIKSGRATYEILREAERFANETYNDLVEDDPLIVNANTCPTARRIDPITNLYINLEAIEKMLMEFIGKEGNKIESGLKEEYENKL